MAATGASPKRRQPSIAFRHVQLPIYGRSGAVSLANRAPFDHGYDGQYEDLQPQLLYRHVSAPVDYSWRNRSPPLHESVAHSTSFRNDYESNRAASPASRTSTASPRPKRPTYYDEDEQQDDFLEEWERQEELATKQRGQSWKWPSNEGAFSFFVDSLDGGRATSQIPPAFNNDRLPNDMYDGSWVPDDPEDWGDLGEASVRTPGIFDDDLKVANFAHLDPAQAQAQAQAPFPTSPQHSRHHSRNPNYTHSEVYEIPRAMKGLGLRLLDEGEQGFSRRQRGKE